MLDLRVNFEKCPFYLKKKMTIEYPISAGIVKKHSRFHMVKCTDIQAKLEEGFLLNEVVAAMRGEILLLVMYLWDSLRYQVRAAFFMYTFNIK